MFRLLLVISLSVCCISENANAETFTVAGPGRVEDRAFLNNGFAACNFEVGPVIEVGTMCGIYETHSSFSLVRFDLRNITCDEVTAATMRLYKPRSFVQTEPVTVSVHQVMPPNSEWAEGEQKESFEKMSVPQKVSRRFFRQNTRRNGSLLAGEDYSESPLSEQVAPDNEGRWLEFPLPAALVQGWIEDPTGNVGLLLRTESNADQYGHHAYFYSVEHYSRKGPQLVVQCESDKKISSRTRSPEAFLPSDDTLCRWLESDMRLARFAKHLDLDREQSRLFCYFDTTIRQDLILRRYQGPLEQNIRNLKALLEGDDTRKFRLELGKFRGNLLQWEYIRETNWYTAGPLADVLTAEQLARLFTECIFGRMEESAEEQDKEIWVAHENDELEKHVAEAVSNIAQKLSLNEEQRQVVDEKVAEYERLENQYLTKFKESLENTRRLLANGAPDDALFEAVKQMHLNHEMFLYYQSIYNSPRWSLFMRHAPAKPFAEWVVQGRENTYTEERIEKQRKDIEQVSGGKEDQEIGRMMDSRIPPLQLSEVRTVEVFGLLSTVSGLNIVPPEEIEGVMTLGLKGMTLRKVLDLLMKPSGYSWERKGRDILITASPGSPIQCGHLSRGVPSAPDSEEERLGSEKMNTVIPSLNLQDVSAAEVLLFFSRISEMNVVAGDELQGDVDELIVRDKTAREFLEMLLDPRGLTYEQIGCTIIVRPKE